MARSSYTLKRYEVYQWNAAPSIEAGEGGHYPFLDLKVPVRNRFIAAVCLWQYEGTIIYPPHGAIGLTLREQGINGEVWTNIRSYVHTVPLMSSAYFAVGQVDFNLYDAEYSPGNLFPEVTAPNVVDAINESGATPERLATSGLRLVLWVLESV